jgi:hypothetical protein
MAEPMEEILTRYATDEICGRWCVLRLIGRVPGVAKAWEVAEVLPLGSTENMAKAGAYLAAVAEQEAQR